MKFSILVPAYNEGVIYRILSEFLFQLPMAARRSLLLMTLPLTVRFGQLKNSYKGVI